MKRSRAGAAGAPVTVRPAGPRWFHGLVVLAGLGYLATIFLNSAGSRLPREVLPAPALYFAQVACLFPRAAIFTIEYRLQAYACDQQRFVPFDHRPYFPMHPNDKENRLHRAAHFYRRNAQTMRALETYVVNKHNQRPASQRQAAGVDGPIGGIQVLSLRIPFPGPDETPVARYHYDPVAPVPADWRKLWYITPKTRRTATCEAGP